MPLWPFRRKSRRKRGRDSSQYAGGLPPQSQTVPDVVMTDAPAPERQTSKRKRTEPNKLHRRPRSYSFSPGRQDSVQLGRKRSARERDAAPHSDYRLRGSRGNGSTTVGAGVGASKEEMLWRIPTLRNKRDGDPLLRKMSSKRRRKNDQQREAEIKAMCNLAPLRPATEDWMLGRPMKKESRKARATFPGGFGGFKSPEFERYNRSSDISLPLPESIDSALSSDSEYISFKVSALEALAPRPTLRYTTHPRPGAGVHEDTGLMRQPSQQRTKLAAPIPEATLRAHKRVDSLADDLSASDLRELMERDQRRRARKRQLEQERLEQRIARQAEKQKAAEAEAARNGRESPPNLERGILGREDVGLGVDPVSAVVTSSRIRNTDPLPRPADEHLEPSGLEAGRAGGPLTSFHRVDSVPLHPADAPSENGGQTLPTLTSAGSRASFRRKLSRSKSPRESDSRTEQFQKEPSETEGSTARAPRSWSSFFPWANRNKRHSGGPSSFSNTSRDSVQMTHSPTPPLNPVPRRIGSTVPKRTMSRFREDLPELPLSPPASRLQSPDADPNRSSVEASQEPGVVAETSPPSPNSSQTRRLTPAFEQQSADPMRQTPSTFTPTDEPGVSPEPQAMSLASIDSEGSWFSGRLSKKRKSSGILEQAPGFRVSRHSPKSDSERRPQNENTNDDIDITDDDYLSRLAPSQGDRSAWNRKSTGEARPSSDWGDGEAHWGSVKGQHPTLVSSHVAGRVKSREGLLKSFTGTEGEGFSGLEGSDDSSDTSGDVGLQRATSIDYGKAHARRVSAGSARLLSITPRSSVDAKQTVPHLPAQDA